MIDFPLVLIKKLLSVGDAVLRFQKMINCSFVLLKRRPFCFDQLESDLTSFSISFMFWRIELILQELDIVVSSAYWIELDTI